MAAEGRVVKRAVDFDGHPAAVNAEVPRRMSAFLIPRQFYPNPSPRVRAASDALRHMQAYLVIPTQPHRGAIIAMLEIGEPRPARSAFVPIGETWP
jgi:hypothetical protein